MEGTRQSIIKFLQRTAQATLADLSLDLGLSTATLRRHLDILQRDNLVEYKEVRKQKGRPEFSYSLTEAGQESLPKDYHRLLGMFLEEVSRVDRASLESGSDPESGSLVESLFTQVSQKVTATYLRKLDPTPDSNPIELLRTFLQEENFSPEFEEADGLQIKLLNCPFRSVAMNNPLVCAYDRSLITEMMSGEAIREMSIQDGSPCCIYRIEPPGATVPL